MIEKVKEEASRPRFKGPASGKRIMIINGSSNEMWFGEKGSRLKFNQFLAIGI